MKIHRVHNPQTQLVVAVVKRILSSEPNTFVSHIKDCIKALKESKTIDEIKPLANVRTEVIHNEINTAGGAASEGIQLAWPELGVCGEGVSNRPRYHTSAIWQFSFWFSPVFTGLLVSGNLGNLEWEYILQIVKGQVRIDFTRLNLAWPCRQVSWKTDMGFHVATFQGFFRFFPVFSGFLSWETPGNQNA